MSFGTYNYNGDLNWIVYDYATNQITITGDSYWFEDAIAEFPARITVSVKAIPTYNGDTRSVWPGAFYIYFNPDYDTIGSVCGQDLDGASIDQCDFTSLIEPAKAPLLSTQVGADSALIYTFDEVSDTESVST